MALPANAGKLPGAVHNLKTSFALLRFEGITRMKRRARSVLTAMMLVLALLVIASAPMSAAQAAASLVAHEVGLKTVGGIAWTKAASALGDLSILTAQGPGSLVKTVQDAEAGVSVVNLLTGNASRALGNIASYTHSTSTQYVNVNAQIADHE